MNSADVVIVGGGVIGMMSARELADAGASVILIERSEIASEASWAGGGIVSPLYPWRYGDAITALASWSQHGYLALSRRLLDETGIDPELRSKGLLMLAVEDADRALQWGRRCQRSLDEVPADFVYQLEPRLREGIDRALWMPEVASIRNPRLGQALKRSLELHPKVRLYDRCPMQSLDMEQGRVVAVNTPKGKLRAGQVLIASGAWSGAIAERLKVSLPVAPVKGQMLLFRAEPGLLDRVVLDRGRYLIPRQDGRILVGSTLEFQGFDKRTTRQAHDSLLQSALSIMPALEKYALEAQWAGLRPGSPGGVPYIDRMPGFDNLYINAGHFRNGLVLAPAACRLVADLMLGREPEIAPEPYRCSAPREDRIH